MGFTVVSAPHLPDKHAQCQVGDDEFTPILHKRELVARKPVSATKNGAQAFRDRALLGVRERPRAR